MDEINNTINCLFITFENWNEQNRLVLGEINFSKGYFSHENNLMRDLPRQK